MKEQRELMVEEIQVQLQQLELMEKKAKQMHVSHVEEGWYHKRCCKLNNN